MGVETCPNMVFNPFPPLPIHWGQGLVSIIQNVLETRELAIGRLVCKMHNWQLTNQKQLPNILWTFITGLSFNFITVWVFYIYPLFAVYGLVWKKLSTSGWPNKGTKCIFLKMYKFSRFQVGDSFLWIVRFKSKLVKLLPADLLMQWVHIITNKKSSQLC